MHALNITKDLKKEEKPSPFGLKLDSIQWKKAFYEERKINSISIKTCLDSMEESTLRRKRNKFLKDLDLLPFNERKHLKKKEKPIPWGLRPASFQGSKPLKDKRETDSFCI